jgi:hypothetical protein
VFLCFLCFFKKCLSGKTDITVLADYGMSIKQRRDGLRGGSTILLATREHSKSYLESYIPRDVKLFNSLSYTVKSLYI